MPDGAHRLTVVLLLADLLAVPFCLGMASLSWRRRVGSPAASGLALALAGTAVWSAASALNSLVVLQVLAPGTTHPAYALMMPGIAAASAGLGLMSAGVADSAWRPGRRTRVLVAGFVTVTAGLAAADPWLEALIIVRAVRPDLPWLVWSGGWAYLPFLTICYGLVAWGTRRLLHARRHAGALHRAQVDALLLGAVIIVPPSLLLATSFSGDRPDATPAVFCLVALIDAYALFRLGLLRLVPLARGLVLDRMLDAVVVLDGADRVLDVNGAGHRLLRELSGRQGEDISGQPLTDLVGPHHAELFEDGERPVDLPGGRVVLHVRRDQVDDDRGHRLAEIVVLRDVTELAAQQVALSAANDRLRGQLATIEQLRATLAEQAVRDELTGLYNRRHLAAVLDEEIARSGAARVPLSVLLVDIDHFKSVNDRYGHTVGDDLLRQVAQRLEHEVGALGTVARYGGEEFVVVLPGHPPEGAAALADEWRAVCAAVCVPGPDAPVRRTLSIGVAGLPTGDDGTRPSAGALLDAADVALYRAKTAGRDRVVLASDPSRHGAASEEHAAAGH